MSQEVLLYVIGGAVAVSAIAMILQAVMLAGIFRASKATREQVAYLTSHAESFFGSAQKSLEQTRKQIADVAAKAGDVLELTRTQLARIDEILSDAASRARVQMDRIELVLDDTVSRLHSTANQLQDGILRPLKEINGLAVGIRAGLGVLFGGKRLTVEQATQDEEMFI
ncbi:MAG: hypothetical protein RMK57_04025 [Bryobacterales bacterium]|nr:hypothetical protein [Bryobacteraceae bacterium]MDW8353678.1 hypothetical protein [Bryobacterales bacterium]